MSESSRSASTDSRSSDSSAPVFSGAQAPLASDIGAPPVSAAVVEEALEVTTTSPDGHLRGHARLWSRIGAKLSVAMFIHNFSVGCWSVTLAGYVKANMGTAGAQMFVPGFVGLIYGAGPLGGMISPFLTGFLADKYFAIERLMALLHAASAVVLALAVAADKQGQFYGLILLFYVFFLPTYTLLTSMAFHQFAEPNKHFPVIRACGTFGWVAAGLFVGLFWPLATGNNIEATSMPLKIGVVVEIFSAFYCLVLPHTPPVRARNSPSAGFKSAAVSTLLWRRPFLLLLIVAAVSHTFPQFYYAYCNVFFNWSGVRFAAAKMTAGQVVEIFSMLALPTLLLRLGFRRTVLLGLATWSLRYFLLAGSADPAGSFSEIFRIVAVLLHGVAFALVSLSLQLVVDRYSGIELRATGQGLIIVATQGVGYFLGAEMAGMAGKTLLPPELDAASAAQWQTFWLYPAWGMAAVAVLALAILPQPEPQSADGVKVSGAGKAGEPENIS